MEEQLQEGDEGEPTIKPAALCLTVFLLFSSLFSVRPADAMHNYEIITAHRGSSGTAPENTISAVRKAIADGAGIAEIDVQLSADGKVVLFHDETLIKFGVAAKVANLTFGYLASIDVAGNRHRAYRGERMPVLEEVIAVARDRIKLNIELKMYDPDSPLPEIVAAIIKREQFADQCLVTSFDPAAIARVMAAHPEIKTGLIVRTAEEITDAMLQSGIAVFSVKSKAVDETLAARLLEAGKELHVWTVNSTNEMKRMLGFEVHSIITDYPHRLYRLIR